MKPHPTASTVRLTATLAACLALAACTTTPAGPAWVPGQQATDESGLFYNYSGSIKTSRATPPLTSLRISWQTASDDHLDK